MATETRLLRSKAVPPIVVTEAGISNETRLEHCLAQGVVREAMGARRDDRLAVDDPPRGIVGTGICIATVVCGAAPRCNSRPRRCGRGAPACGFSGAGRHVHPMVLICALPA